MSCYELTTFDIPNSITKIESGTFAYCKSLESIVIPNSISSIGEDSFYECTGLTEISIGANVETIKSSAFYNCTALKKVINYSALIFKKGSTDYGYVAYYADEIKNYQNATFYCELRNNLWTIVGYDGMIPNLVIPETIDGRRVDAIADGVFSGHTEFMTLVTPSKLLSIGSNAFSGCSNLRSLTIGANVHQIGSNAFGGCNLLTKIKMLPNTPPTIAGNAFESVPLRVCYVSSNNYSGQSYSSLGEIKRYSYLSSEFEVNGVKYIPLSLSERTCFAVDCNYNKNTTNISIGSEVTYRDVSLKVEGIGWNAFRNNDYITSVHLGDNIEYIHSAAFAECDNLASINIPEPVSVISEYMLFGDRKITQLTLPKILDQIKECSLESTGLTSITIPGKVSSIEADVFNDCTALATVTFSDGATPIKLDYNHPGGNIANHPGGGLFCDCPLTSVTIGRNLVYPTSAGAGRSPFANNQHILKVLYTDIPTEATKNAFFDCRSLETVYIGDGVVLIDDYAFSGDLSIKSFAFGKSVESIGAEAFSDCTAMVNLYAEPTTPPVCGSQALDDINKWECTLHVPSSSLNSYKNAAQWKEFLSRNSDFGITLNVDHIELNVNGSYQLIKTLTSSASGAVTWTSTNDEIVTVSSNGLVRAIGVGRASVIAETASGHQANCLVTVGSQISSISFGREKYYVEEGKTLLLEPKINPSNAYAELIWESDATSIVEVSQSGVVTGQKVGTAVIKVKTQTGHTARCTVEVYEHGGTNPDPGQSEDPDQPDDPSGENGDGSLESPYTVDQALEIINAGTYTSDKVYVVGIVSSIKSINNVYKSATYYLSDDGTTNVQLYVYGGYGLNGEDITTSDYIKVGDRLVVYGELINYKGNTPEITTGSHMISINGNSGVEEITVDDETEAKYFNLQGLSIDNPASGSVVIEVRGNSVRKVVIK